MNVTIVIYYTVLPNAVERSVHLHGPSQLPVVNTFLIIHRCQVYNDRCQGKCFLFSVVSLRK
jgi:hypothetical protein